MGLRKQLITITIVISISVVSISVSINTIMMILIKIILEARTVMMVSPMDEHPAQLVLSCRFPYCSFLLCMLNPICLEPTYCGMIYSFPLSVVEQLCFPGRWIEIAVDYVAL